jgi:hypothetical protein
LVDNAFKILAHELNRLLIEIASRQGHQISKAGTDVGKFSFMRRDAIPQPLARMPAPCSVETYINIKP